MKIFCQFVGFVFFLSLVSCNLPQGSSETKTPPTALPATDLPQPASPTKANSPTPSLPPEHHIAPQIWSFAFPVKGWIQRK